MIQGPDEGISSHGDSGSPSSTKLRLRISKTSKATMTASSHIMSPVTPCSRAEPNFDLCNEEERISLRCLRQAAARHGGLHKALLENIRRNNGVSYLKSRHVIVEWLVDVCRAFRFNQATLHITVHYMDRCMAKRPIHKRSWQLCAVASLFIAAKCEEASDSVPQLGDLEYVCGNEYTASAIKHMELVILDLLDWDLVIRTPVHFLRLYERVANRCSNDRAAKLDRFSESSISDQSATPSPSFSDSGSPRAVSQVPLEGDSDIEMTPVREPVRSPSRVYASFDASADDDGDVHSSSSPDDSDGDMESLDMDMDTSVMPFSTTVDDEVFLVAQCLLDLTLYEPHFNAKYKPAVMAASAWAVGRNACTLQSWSEGLCSISGVKQTPEALECYEELLQLFEQARD